MGSLQDSILMQVSSGAKRLPETIFAAEKSRFRGYSTMTGLQIETKQLRLLKRMGVPHKQAPSSADQYKGDQYGGCKPCAAPGTPPDQP